MAPSEANTPTKHIDYLANPSAYALEWMDDFEFFDETRWTIGLKDPATGDMVPAQGGQFLLNDNYAGYITEEDVQVEQEILHLRNQKRSYTGQNPVGEFQYTSGWIMSMHKLQFNGTKQARYLEVKAKFPKGDKVWPAIWLIPEALIWPPEIDLWEYFGQFFEWEKDVMYMRYIHGHYTNTEDVKQKISHFDRDYDCEEWHIYGFQWSATKMIWSIDGKIVNSFERGKDIPTQSWPDEDLYVVMNNGVINVVPDENTTWPNYLSIDYISLFYLK